MRSLYFFILICCSLLGSAQTYRALVDATPTFVDQIDVAQLNENQLYIAMPFAKNNILNPEQERQLNEKAVIKLELVYTKYQKSAAFNQKALNKKRIQELNRLVPSLFENRFWDFKLISQTKADSPEEGQEFFHGFIVTFRPNSTKKTLDLEANYLKDLTAALKKQDSLENDTTPKEFHLGKVRFHPKWGYQRDTIWFADTSTFPEPLNFFYDQTLYNDSTVLNAFSRNKNWKNFIVVTDVTGSMSPYISQVILWLKEQAMNTTVKYFVFFNDGDEKPSKKKKPLETKGIYVTKNKSLGAVIKTTTMCMKNGSGGGEHLENDIEAITDGIKYYPEADEIILVADNMESMRDYKYIKKIKKPVHVILCGAEHRINIQYLDLARQTKGSVHTLKSDVTNLQNIKEMEHFFIDEKEYMYQNGRFHAVYERF